jgi:hypothetical protein
VSIDLEEHWRRTETSIECRPAQLEAHKERLRAALCVAGLREQKGSCAATCWAPWRGWFPRRPLCHIVESVVLEVEPSSAPAPDDGGAGSAVAAGGVDTGFTGVGAGSGSGAGNAGDASAGAPATGRGSHPSAQAAHPIDLTSQQMLAVSLQHHDDGAAPSGPHAQAAADISHSSSGAAGAASKPPVAQLQPPSALASSLVSSLTAACQPPSVGQSEVTANQNHGPTAVAQSVLAQWANALTANLQYTNCSEEGIQGTALADISGDLTIQEDGRSSQGRAGAGSLVIYVQSPPPIPSVVDPDRPHHWAPDHRKRVPLDPASDEYNQAVAHFLRSAGDGYVVEGVERVQNQGQWVMYQSKKREMMGLGVYGADERLLFHGTDEATVDAIALRSFNRSFCGKNATAYGQGVYFARDASYSVNDTYSRPNADGVKHIFLSRVLVGTYAKGDSSMRTPPSKAGIVCDTTVDDTAKPTIFVAYNDAQVCRVNGGGQLKVSMSDSLNEENVSF